MSQDKSDNNSCLYNLSFTEKSLKQVKATTTPNSFITHLTVAVHFLFRVYCCLKQLVYTAFIHIKSSSDSFFVSKEYSSLGADTAGRVNIITQLVMFSIRMTSILLSQEVIRTILTASVQIHTLSNTFIQSYPDSLVVRAGEKLWAVRRELNALNPTQVSTAVSHLFIGLQVPQLEYTHMHKLLYSYAQV